MKVEETRAPEVSCSIRVLLHEGRTRGQSPWCACIKGPPEHGLLVLKLQRSWANWITCRSLLNTVVTSEVLVQPSPGLFLFGRTCPSQSCSVLCLGLSLPQPQVFSVHVLSLCPALLVGFRHPVSPQNCSLLPGLCLSVILPRPPFPLLFPCFPPVA